MAKTLKNKYVYNNIVFPAAQEDARASLNRGSSVLKTEPLPVPLAEIHFRIETVNMPNVEIIKAIEEMLNKLADDAQKA